MTNNFMKVGGLYRTNVTIFAYDKDPYASRKKFKFKPITLEDIFVILDFSPSKNKSNLLFVKILLKDEIKFLFVVENNLIEVKEN